MEPDTPLNVAVILTFPGLTALATPEFEIVATVTSDEVQMTCEVRLITLESLNVPLAVKVACAPAMTDGVGVVTAMDTRVALVTVREAVPTTPPNAAVMAAGEPTDDSPVARPVLLIVATVAGVDPQVTNEVRFWVVGGLVPKLPVATKLVDIVSGTVADGGVTTTDCNGLDSTITGAVFELGIPLYVALITALPAI